MVNPSRASIPSRRVRSRASAPLQPLCDRLQRGLLLRGLPEGADHHGDGPDRAHALAPHVPDDQPDAVRGVLHRIQVSADGGALLRRLVARGDLEAVDPLVGLRQYGALGGLGDLTDGGEALLAAPYEEVDEDGEDGDDDHGHQLGDRLRLVQSAARDAEHEQHGNGGGGAREDRAALRVEGGGDQRRGSEEGGAGEVEGVA